MKITPLWVSHCPDVETWDDCGKRLLATFLSRNIPGEILFTHECGELAASSDRAHFVDISSDSFLVTLREAVKDRIAQERDGDLVAPAQLMAFSSFRAAPHYHRDLPCLAAVLYAMDRHRNLADPPSRLIVYLDPRCYFTTSMQERQILSLFHHKKSGFFCTAQSQDGSFSYIDLAVFGFMPARNTAACVHDATQLYLTGAYTRLPCWSLGTVLHDRFCDPKYGATMVDASYDRWSGGTGASLRYSALQGFISYGPAGALNVFS